MNVELYEHGVPKAHKQRAKEILKQTVSVFLHLLLKKLEERYHDKNIVFVSISSDKDRNVWTKMVREKSLGGIQLNEPRIDSAFFTLFQVNAIPRFILLNPDGTVYDANMSRPSNPDTQQLLDTLLGT